MHVHVQVPPITFEVVSLQPLLAGGRSEKQLCFCRFHESMWSKIGETSHRKVLTEIYNNLRYCQGYNVSCHISKTQKIHKELGKDLKNAPYMGRNFNQSSQLVRHRSQSTMKHESIGN